MIKRHVEGGLTAVVRRITNTSADALNYKIRWLKATARGFRNTDSYSDAL